MPSSMRSASTTGIGKVTSPLGVAPAAMFFLRAVSAAPIGEGEGEGGRRGLGGGGGEVGRAGRGGGVEGGVLCGLSRCNGVSCRHFILFFFHCSPFSCLCARVSVCVFFLYVGSCFGYVPVFLFFWLVNKPVVKIWSA